MPNPWSKEEQERINGIGASAMTVREQEHRESVHDDLDTNTGEAPQESGMGAEAAKQREDEMLADAHKAIPAESPSTVYSEGVDPAEAQRQFNEKLQNGYFSAIANREIPDTGDVDMDAFSVRAMRVAAAENGMELPPDEELMPPKKEEEPVDPAEEGDAISQEEAEQSVEVAKTSVDVIRDSAEQIMDIVKELGDSVEELSDAPTEENLEMAEEMDAGMLPGEDTQADEQRPAVAAAKVTADKRKSAIVIQMQSDPRVPRGSMGYFSVLHSDNSSKESKDDALEQLAKYVPDLVMEYKDADKNISAAKVKADYIGAQELTDHEKVIRNMKVTRQAEYTNRLIPGDEDYEHPEWSEYAVLDGVPIIVYYRTTPEDQKMVEENGGDFGAIDWEDRIDRIVIDLDKCDRQDISDEAMSAVVKKYGPTTKTASKEGSIADSSTPKADGEDEEPLKDGTKGRADVDGKLVEKKLTDKAGKVKAVGDEQEGDGIDHEALNAAIEKMQKNLDAWAKKDSQGVIKTYYNEMMKWAKENPGKSIEYWDDEGGGVLFDRLGNEEQIVQEWGDGTIDNENEFYSELVGDIELEIGNKLPEGYFTTWFDGAAYIAITPTKVYELVEGRPYNPDQTTIEDMAPKAVKAIRAYASMHRRIDDADFGKVCAGLGVTVKAAKKVLAEEKTHELKIKSLDDAQLECSQGDWSYSRTGAITREEANEKFQEHLDAIGKKKTTAAKVEAINVASDDRTVRIMHYLNRNKEELGIPAPTMDEMREGKMPSMSLDEVKEFLQNHPIAKDGDSEEAHRQQNRLMDALDSLLQSDPDVFFAYYSMHENDQPSWGIFDGQKWSRRDGKVTMKRHFGPDEDKTTASLRKDYMALTASKMPHAEAIRVVASLYKVDAAKAEMAVKAKAEIMFWIAYGTKNTEGKPVGVARFIAERKAATYEISLMPTGETIYLVNRAKVDAFPQTPYTKSLLAVFDACKKDALDLLKLHPDDPNYNGKYWAVKEKVEGMNAVAKKDDDDKPEGGKRNPFEKPKAPKKDDDDEKETNAKAERGGERNRPFAHSRVADRRASAGLMDGKQVKWDIYFAGKKKKSMLFPPSFDKRQVVDTLVEKYGYHPDTTVKKAEDQTVRSQRSATATMTREEAINVLRPYAGDLLGKHYRGDRNDNKKVVDAVHALIPNFEWPDWDKEKIGDILKKVTARRSATAVSKGEIEDMIRRFNEAGSNFRLGETYGQYDLWATDKEGKEHRLESGSANDIKQALIKYRFNEKYQKATAGEHDEVPAETEEFESASKVADTILDQLGGQKFLAMTGAQPIIGGKGKELTLKLPAFAKDGINTVTIGLNSEDLYDVVFSRYTNRPKATYTVVDEVKGVYAEDLQRIFTDHTGLETSLGTMRGQKATAGDDQDKDFISRARSLAEKIGVSKENIEKAIAGDIDAVESIRRKARQWYGNLPESEEQANKGDFDFLLNLTSTLGGEQWAARHDENMRKKMPWMYAASQKVRAENTAALDELREIQNWFSKNPIKDMPTDTYKKMSGEIKKKSDRMRELMAVLYDETPLRQAATAAKEKTFYVGLKRNGAALTVYINDAAKPYAKDSMPPDLWKYVGELSEKEVNSRFGNKETALEEANRIRPEKWEPFTSIVFKGKKPVTAAATGIKEGDLVKVDMAVVKRRDNMPPYIRLVQKTIRDAENGTPYVAYVKNGMAEIRSWRGNILGDVSVPVEACTVVGSASTSLDDYLPKEDVTAAKKPGGIDVRQSKGKWEVVDRKDNDKVLGTHDTEEKAREQQKAIYASMNATAATFKESPEEIMAKLPADKKENYLVPMEGDEVLVEMPKMNIGDEGSIDMFIDVSSQYLPDDLKNKEIVTYFIREDGVLEGIPREWITNGAHQEEWDQWFRDFAKKRGLSDGVMLALVDWPDIGMVTYFDTGTDKYPWAMTLERKGGTIPEKKPTTAAANPIDIGDGYYAHKIGYDRNGNWAVWVSKGSNPALKIRTNGEAPEAHRARGKYRDLAEAVAALSDRARDELKDYHKRFGAKAVVKKEGGDARPPFPVR